MTCTPNYLKLEGLTHIGDSGHTTQLENNLKMYLDWAFLGAGGWLDTSLGTTDAGVYGGDFSKLRLVTDPTITTKGKVWEAARKDWVWESGQTYTNKSNVVNEPIQVSGVYVNGVFQASGFYIDYPNGRVVLDVAATGVEVEYSYRYIQVYCASKTSWFNDLQFGSFRIDQGGFQVEGSGQWNNVAEKRVQMPAVVVEIVKTRSFRPYEMGNLAHFSNQDVLFHVLAETAYERDLLTDALSPQENKVLWLFDINAVLADNNYPLNEYGSKVNNLTYKDFVSDGDAGYRWNKCYIAKSTTQDITSPDPKLFRSVVKWNLETIQGNI